MVADRLYPALAEEERGLISTLAGDLKQSIIAKMPPLSRYHLWRVKRGLRGQRPPSAWWPPLFPDVLLIDSDTSFPTSAVWWYAENGRVTSWGEQDATDRDRANLAFRAVCRQARGALWSNYDPENLGGVAIAASPTSLGAEAFFARNHYQDWLRWVANNAENDTAARQLSGWFTAEYKAIDRFLTSRRPSNGDATIKVLDLGCGSGRHLLDLVNRDGSVRGVGVDINHPRVAEATREAVKLGIDHAATFIVDDLSGLTSLRDEEIDLAICMTNTLGNLAPHKQEKLIRRLSRVLKPGGSVLVSGYAEGTEGPRIRSYRAVNLDVERQGERIVAIEGLESEAFSETRLRRLLDENGLDVQQMEPLGTIGVMAIAAKPAVEIAPASPPERDSSLETRPRRSHSQQHRP